MGTSMHEAHGPYWKRAHRDWRVRLAALVMALAMIIYVMTENLGWRGGYPASMPHQAPATPR